MDLHPNLPYLETERANIRLADRQDRDAILDYYLSNRERFTPVSPPWPEDFFTRKFWERQIDFNREEFYSDKSARLFIFDNDDKSQVIGNVSLGGIMRSAAQFCYLGYNIAKHKEGQGLMMEAVPAVIEYGFTEMNLHRIMANYMPTNERSGKLLERLGFTIEGYAHEYLYLNGRWEDHIMTVKTNPRWRR